MSTSAKIPHIQVRSTRLAWRQPHTSAPSKAPAPAPTSIESTYGKGTDTAFPATAFVGALTSTAVLFVAFGLLALPTAAFA